MSKSMKFVTDLNKGVLGKPDSADMWEEVISHISDEQLLKPNCKILVIAAGHGTEAVIIAKRMISLGINKDKVNNSIYLIDKYIQFTNALTVRLGFTNVIQSDFLEWETDMKFDIVIGNPPYQKNTNNTGAGQTLWDLIIIKSIDLIKDGGVLSMIHPAGWRNQSGSFTNVKEILFRYDMKYLNINNISDGLNTFGVATRYDSYVLIKSESIGFKTHIVSETGEEYQIDIKHLPFIPNFNIDFCFSLLAKDGEDTVNIVGNRSMYGADKSHMSVKEDDEYTHPCVKYISKKSHIPIDFRYSKIKSEMFGTPKVMFGIGAQVGKITVDSKGEYGLCQFVYGVADSANNLKAIQQAMNSPKFIDVMKALQFSTQAYNYKIIAKFRKDFWKDFI